MVYFGPTQERGSKEIRARAESALQNMTASNLFRCGLTCDYATECLALLRKHFDIDDPDPAQTVAIAEQFQERMCQLFIKGYVLGDSRSADAASCEGRSMTQVVFEQIEIPEPIFYGSKVHYLCTAAQAQEVRAIMVEMGNIVQDMLDRLQVDLAGDEVVQLLAIFNLTGWGVDAAKTKKLISLAERLSEVLGFNKQQVVQDFYKCAKMLRKLQEAAHANKLELTNRSAWSLVLIPEWRCKFFSNMSFKHPDALAGMVSFYLTLKTNTTTLERNLGELCRQLCAHSGPLDQNGKVVGAILEVALDGPRADADMFQSSNAGSAATHRLEPTEFSRACAKLWIRCFGRRFQYKYKEGKRDKRASGRTDSFASVQRKHAQAMNALSKKHTSDPEVPSFIPGLSLPLAPPCPVSSVFNGTRWSTSSAPSGPCGSSGPCQEGERQGRSKRKKHPAELFREHTARKRARFLGRSQRFID